MPQAVHFNIFRYQKFLTYILLTNPSNRQKIQMREAWNREGVELSLQIPPLMGPQGPTDRRRRSHRLISAAGVPLFRAAALITAPEIGCINYSGCKWFQTVCCLLACREAALLPPLASTSITPHRSPILPGWEVPKGSFTVFHPWITCLYILPVSCHPIVQNMQQPHLTHNSHVSTVKAMISATLSTAAY